MRVRDLERLYDYNYWANKQLMGVVSRLPPEHGDTAVEVGRYTLHRDIWTTSQPAG